MSPRKIKLIALPALVGASLLVAAGGAFAADERVREAVVSVAGEGRSVAAPDTAIVTLSVVKQAKTAQEALAENNKTVASVLEALKSGGIAERDLQTTGFSIQPQFNFQSGNDGQQRPPEVVGYQAMNTLTVRVRDLSKLGGLVDQAVGLGVNQGGDIQFVNDKPEGALNEARKLAVADAIAKAKTLSEAAGVKLGRLVNISEVPAHQSPQPVFRATMMKAADAGVPIQGGENTYNVTVTVTYALEQ
ncbi:SIMPL domain-containing protein [Rhizobium sp. RAF56]|jgi:uncharacterized protein YggE|uniref:SIMPL domain-containing protein n=1 Tax=Rhizobium sp. RAF56 TaxID=3233062 RepID=UPI003F9CF907